MIAESQREFDEFHRYLAAAAELRLIIEQNFRDYNFGRSGGKIVYIFDANIIQLFLNPTKEAGHFLKFGRSANVDDHVATAMVTTEFLFSRMLSGQQGTPAYLSEGHAEDVANIIRKISSNAELVQYGGFPSDTEKERLHLLARKARSGALEPRDAIRRLTSAFPEIASLLFTGPLYEARQLRRLLAEDMIRPLRLLPEAAGNIVNPDDVDIDIWTDLLQDERSPRDRLSRKVRDLLTRRDAMTMAQLVKLNARAEQYWEKTRYVLVTTDNTMRRAYDKWFYRGTGDFDNYALRHPSQYIPILNAEQMENKVGNSELIDHVRDVIDSLFKPLQEDGGDYMQTLMAIANPSSFSYDDDVNLSIFDKRMLMALRGSWQVNEIRALEKGWDEAIRGAVLLNAPILKRHFDHGWQGIIRILESVEGKEDQVLSYVTDLLSKVEAIHAEFVVEGFMRLNDLPGSGNQSRLPRPLVRTKDETTLAVIRALDLTELGDAVRSAFPKMGSASENLSIDTMMLSACVSYRLGQWNTVAQFSKNAATVLANATRRLSGRNEAAYAKFLRYEFTYLDASAAKYRIDYDEYRRAMDLLDQCVEYHSEMDDEIGILRAECEKVSLQVSFTGWAIRGIKEGSHAGFEDDLNIQKLSIRIMKAFSFTAKSHHYNDGLVVSMRQTLRLNLLKAVAIDTRFFRSRGFGSRDDLDLLELIYSADGDPQDHHYDALYAFCMFGRSESAARRSWADRFERSFERAHSIIADKIELWLLEELNSRVQRR